MNKELSGKKWNRKGWIKAEIRKKERTKRRNGLREMEKKNKKNEESQMERIKIGTS